MASGDVIDLVRPPQLFPLNGYAFPTQPVPSFSVGMLPLFKNANPYTFTSFIPSSATVSTGLTFGIEITDAGTDANDLGKVVKWGITVKRLVSGTSNSDITASAATEATQTVTLNATTGVLVTSTIAIANASLNSITAGDRFLVQIRRLGADTADTANSTVLINNVTVVNT